MITEEAIKNVFEVYQKNKTMSLSTFGDSLWSSRVYFASHGLYIYAVIEKSRNYENILKNNRVSFVIEKGVPDLFIQGEGDVEILGKPDDCEKERALLFQKNIELIPFVKKIRDVLVIRIKPVKIFLSDFRTLFKPRKEIAVSDADLQRGLELDRGEPAWKVYLKATRPFAFTATFISVLAGAGLAREIDPWLLLLTLAGVMLLHAGINALNDLMDYRYGIDDWLVLGASRVLQDKLMTQRRHFTFIAFLIGLGCAVGAVLA
ncbi:MAG: prenyltransferase, partial [Deltaproteobacteria bacterium]|nr:prenyltransferase [Deltaproteobacteria bacterium]